MLVSEDLEHGVQVRRRVVSPAPARLESSAAAFGRALKAHVSAAPLQNVGPEYRGLDHLFFVARHPLEPVRVGIVPEGRDADDILIEKFAAYGAEHAQRYRVEVVDAGHQHGFGKHGGYEV